MDERTGGGYIRHHTYRLKLRKEKKIIADIQYIEKKQKSVRGLLGLFSRIFRLDHATLFFSLSGVCVHCKNTLLRLFGFVHFD